MMRFIIGFVVGIVATNWYYTNGDTISSAIEQMWDSASAAPEHMQKQDPDKQGLKGKRF